MDFLKLSKKYIKQIPGVRWLRQKRAKRFYLSPQGYASEYGVFSSFSEARDFLPQSKEFNTDPIATEYVTVRTNRIFPYDYPVIFWLKKALDSGSRTIFDIGGSVGVHYYAYRKYIDYPTDLKWHIYEVLAIAERGRQLAIEKNVNVLSFANSLDLKNINADIWISAGALHYIENASGLGEWLSLCRRQPTHIFLNKLPIYNGQQFISTQNIGNNAFAPHYVYNRNEFISQILDSGYNLVDEWDVPERKFDLFDDPARSFGNFTGIYFRKF